MDVDYYGYEWRQGRRVGRCIHAMTAPVPSEEDVLIGVMDSPHLSQHIVEIHNAALRLHTVYGDNAIRQQLGFPQLSS